MINRKSLPLVILIIVFTFFGCNKDQRKVNKIVGEWQVISYKTVDSETGEIEDLIKDSNFGLNYRFHDCKLNKNEFCVIELSYFNYLGDLDFVFDLDYRISEGGEWLEMGHANDESSLLKYRILDLYNDDFTIELSEASGTRTIAAIRM